jgi:hypothetical protein
MQDRLRRLQLHQTLEQNPDGQPLIAAQVEGVQAAITELRAKLSAAAGQSPSAGTMQGPALTESEIKRVESELDILKEQVRVLHAQQASTPTPEAQQQIAADMAAIQALLMELATLRQTGLAPAPGAK